jgi:nuclear receptor interaction protein
MLAVSGIDSTIKIFSPDARSRRDARHAHGINTLDTSTYAAGNTRRRRRRRANGGNTADRDTQTGDPAVGLATEEAQREFEQQSDSDSEQMYDNGLRSRQMMQNEYQIRSENDRNRRTGNNQRYISRGVMELLAARLGASVNQLEDAENDCTVM